MKPLILVTTGLHTERTHDNAVESIIVGCDINYLDAINIAGGAPVMLPSVFDTDALHTILDAADGLLLTGGRDIHAEHYGEEPHQTSLHHDQLRDRVELTLTRAAVARHLPILGICRGLQMLNVAHDGTLVQDIPSQVPEAVKHLADGLDLILQHHIDIEPGTLLERVMGARTMDVNSWHHQAVREVGAGLRINARARDGVVEGIESAEGYPLLAVQCHPEESVGTFPTFRQLFSWLIAEAKAYHQRKQQE